PSTPNCERRRLARSISTRSREGRIFSQFAPQTAVAPAAIAGEVRRTVRDVLRTVSVAKVTTLVDQVEASIVLERLMALLMGLFGALGLVLTARALCGLPAYTVVGRTDEIGIRMALGARGSDVIRLVLATRWGWQAGA